ncbi:MAG: hypothetical protein V4732_20570 [Pseudomonadota bacterium]
MKTQYLQIIAMIFFGFSAYSSASNEALTTNSIQQKSSSKGCNINCNEFLAVTLNAVNYSLVSLDLKPKLELASKELFKRFSAIFSNREILTSANVFKPSSRDSIIIGFSDFDHIAIHIYVSEKKYESGFLEIKLYMQKLNSVHTNTYACKISELNSCLDKTFKKIPDYVFEKYTAK